MEIGNNVAGGPYDFLTGDGSVRALLQAKDWSRFQLGPPSSWPTSLKTVLQLMLDSTEPMSVAWGSDLLFFYNDAYVSLLGQKHPWALTSRFWDVWPEVQPSFGPIMARALKAIPTANQNSPFQILRRGYLENAWFSYSLLPIRNEQGAVAGVFNTVTETTERVETESRQAFNLELAQQLRRSSTAQEVVMTSIEMLGKRLSVCRVLYGEVDEGERSVYIRHEWDAEGTTNLAGQSMDLDDFGADMSTRLLAGEIIVNDDVNADDRTFRQADAYHVIGVTSYVLVPLPTTGRLRVVLALHRAKPYRWREDEVRLIKETGQSTWLAAEAARTEAALRESDAKLQESEHWLATALSASRMGTFDYDPANDQIKLTQASIEVFGLVPGSTLPTTSAAFAIVHPGDVGSHSVLFLDAVQRGTDYETQYRVIRPRDGQVAWIAERGSTVIDPVSQRRRVRGIHWDITAHKQAEEKLLHASLHDPLTGLPNRNMLFEYASHLLPRNQRAKRRAAVLFIDLDKFKPINDAHGHDIGDKILKQVANRLSQSLRSEDIVIRLGGDEFVILLQDIKSEETILEVVRHITEQLTAPYRIGELKLMLSLSVGISIYPNDGEDIDSLISHADLAMYQVKQAGRNSFQFYSPELTVSTRRQTDIELQIRNTLSKKEFFLHYQPVIDFRDGSVIAVEALLRWNNAAVGPDEFVPVAEASGFINPIGRWLLEEVALQHNKWIEHGLPAVPISFNVSAVEFRDPEFMFRVLKTLHKHKIETSVLQLEVTETSVMTDVEYAISLLNQLRQVGFKISLDDFGTGHSSLAQLARLPLDKVKIDRSFVETIETNTSNRAITNAMIGLGHSLGLDVIVEGLETKQATDYVLLQGCRFGQGFYLGRPMSGDEFERWFSAPRIFH